MKQTLKKLISIVIALSMMMSILVIPVNAASVFFPKSMTITTNGGLAYFRTTSSVKCTNSNPKVATVVLEKYANSEYCVTVSPLKPGTTTVSLKIGSKTSKCKVTVPKTFAPTIQLPKSLTLPVNCQGEQKLGVVSNVPSLSVKSSNPKAISVKADSEFLNSYYILIIPKKPGTSTISVTAGGKTYKCKVTLPKYVNPISSIKLNKTVISGNKFATKSTYTIKSKSYKGKKCPLNIKLKSGWQLVTVKYYNYETYMQESLYGEDTVYDSNTGTYDTVFRNKKSVKISGNNSEIQITVKNKKTGIQEYLCLCLK